MSRHRDKFTVDNDRDDGTQDYIVAVVVLSMLITIPVRILVRLMKLPFSQNTALILIGVSFGIILIAIEPIRDFQRTLDIAPTTHFNFYVPIFITSTIYRVETFIFRRCILQALTIVMLGTILSALSLGLIMGYWIHDWSLIQGILVALVSIPIEPLHAIVQLRDVTRYGYLRTMLEAEAVLILIPVCIIVELMLGIQYRYVTIWQEVFWISMRLVVGGVIVGLIMGHIYARIMRWLYNEPGNAVVVSIGVNYFVYFLCEKLLNVSGALAIIVLNCIVVAEKHHMTNDVNRNLTHFWNSIYFFAEAPTLMICAATITIFLGREFDLTTLYGTLVIYIAGVSLRLIRFLLMSPLLNLMTYELNVKCLVILGWCDIKGCINLILVLKLFPESKSHEYALNCMLEILAYTFLSLLINSGGTLIILRFFDLNQLSIQRKRTLNKCMLFIREKRTALIEILKMNRFLRIGNWHQLRLDTNLKAPYKDLEESEYEILKRTQEENLWIDGKECPGCTVDFPLTHTNLTNLLKETEVNVLKAKKISIRRQYENGIINKHCLDVLLHYLDITYECDKARRGLSLYTFLKKNMFLDITRRTLARFYAHKPYANSQSKCANFFHYLTLHIGYEVVLLVIIISYAVAAIVIEDEEARGSMVLLHVLLTLLFLVDFIFKLLGLSFVWMLLSGIKPYFSTKRNIIDFCLLIIALLNLKLATQKNIFKWWYYYVIPPPRLIAVIRLVQIPNMLSFLCPFIIKFIDDRIDSALCFDFDLATALLNSAEEILVILPQLIEVRMIKDVYLKSVSEEKNTLIKKMDTVQKERPWIAITVKTKQAIRSSLTAMEVSLNQFKISGLIDNIEYMFIFTEIFKKQKLLRDMKNIQPSSPKMIFKEVLWMGDDEDLMNFLFNNAQMVKWQRDEVVVKAERQASGIYIILSGMLRLKYQPRNEFISNNNRCIPIVDYLSTVNFCKEIEDNIVPGNSIGELSILTRRPSDCKIFSLSPSSAYWLPLDVIKEAMSKDNNPVNGLQSRMWKCAVVHLASAILMEYPLYKSFTQYQIKFKLERSFVPNLLGYKLFVITELMDDIILIEGIVYDQTTGDQYKAPMLIPKTIQRLLLITNAMLETSLENRIPPRLLIIPVGNVSAIDIMEQEEGIGEFLPLPPEECFLKRRTTNNRPDFMPGVPAQVILSIPSNTGSHYDYQRYLEIIKLDESTDSIEVLPEEEYEDVPMLLKRNRMLDKKHGQSDNNSVNQEFSD